MAAIHQGNGRGSSARDLIHLRYPRRARMSAGGGHSAARPTAGRPCDTITLGWLLIRLNLSINTDGARLDVVAEPSEGLSRMICDAGGAQASAISAIELIGTPSTAPARVPELPVNPLGAEPTLALPTPPLTQREREVLKLVVEGLANKQIAGSVNRSERTVKAHLTAIFTKLGVDNRTQAAALAIEKQLV
jgi:DNA-binding CsgD family transcriptional regulator